jgi:predicted Zn-dependent protease
LSPPGQTRAAAREAAEHAVALDSDHPEAFAAAAAYELLYGWNLDQAESILADGLARTPASDELLLMRALAHAARGRLGEAARDLDEAARISPSSPLVLHLRASIDFHSENFGEAIERCRALLEWAPDYPLTWLLLSRAQARLTMFGEASEALDTFERLAGEGAIVLSHRAVLRALAGRMEDARALSQRIDAIARDHYVPPMTQARARLSLGETDLALDDLERAREERSLSMLWLGIDPDYASLREEPRFQAIAGRYGVN